MGFKERLKELREDMNITQEQLANMLQVTRQAVGNYEQGSRFPKDENLLKRIADIFDVSLDYLLGRVNDDAKSEVLIDKVISDYIGEKEEIYQTDKITAFKKILMSVNDLPEETIDKISDAILELKHAFEK